MSDLTFVFWIAGCGVYALIVSSLLPKRARMTDRRMFFEMFLCGPLMWMIMGGIVVGCAWTSFEAWLDEEPKTKRPS